MDKIAKILRKLDRKRREAILLVLRQIEKDYEKLNNLEPLSGFPNYYRTRVGRYRIIFEVINGKKTEVKKISKRDNQTYKNLQS